MGVHRLDRQGRFTAINEDGLRVLGLGRQEQVLGSDYAEWVAPEDRPRVEARLREAVEGRASVFEFKGPRGKVYSASLVPLQVGAPPCREVFGVCTEITRRRQTEQALAQSEERYRLLVERSPCCIHQIDLDGKLTSMNRAGLCMMGVETEAQVIGTPYLDAVGAGDRPRVEALLREAYAGRSSQFEFEATNGRVFASSFVPICDEAGSVTRLMGLTQDVTAQKLSERTLLDTRRSLELALQGADLQLWEEDLSEEQVAITGLNPTPISEAASPLARVVRPREEVLGQCHPEDRAEVRRRFAEHLQGGSAQVQSEHRIRGDDGDWRWVLVQGRVVERDEADAPTRVAGTLLDVTARHTAEEDRRELEARLQQAQKLESVGLLAGGIAHDFNNLLQVILGHASLMVDTLPADSAQREDARTIMRAAERGAQLTRQLLTFSRQEPSRRRVVVIEEQLESLTGMLSRVLPATITLALEPEQGVPRVSVDPAQLEQVVLNLCVNARDALGARGGRITISLRATEDPSLGRCAELLVRDDGCGMDAAARERAFDPFFTTKGPQAGTGLGLAMVYGIVRQNGGVVDIDSVPGVGTSVSVRFPAAEDDPTAPDVDSPGIPRPRAATILVVEDEKLVRDLFVHTLSNAGYEVLAAPDGLAGLEVFRAQQERIDLLLVDAVMPRMGGQELVEQVRRVAPGVPVLFTSGYHESEALSLEFLTAHRLKMLAKPHLPSDLLRAVGALLSRSSA